MPTFLKVSFERDMAVLELAFKEVCLPHKEVCLTEKKCIWESGPKIDPATGVTGNSF